ncbi:MBOAT family protein [Histomonas meleagridis]|uniref:MBOAT family protein n=1 Tax=Histomonas meleagridis TaxID=135588 RepID=UPI003559C49B|nr:MBOAT family protein [Histomonas meleagridis]KAH0796624.1 MBOAT family protein [Histomonas meleagridis]
MLFLPGSLCLSTLIVPIIGLFFVHRERLRQSEEWKSDLSGLVMFTSLRVITIIFNVFDGRKKQIKRKQWAENALKSPPSLFRFITFLFNYNGLYSGPIITIQAYEATIKIETNDEETTKDIKDGFKFWMISNGFLVFYAILVQFLPANYVLSESFIAKPYLIKVVLAITLSFVHTSRYLFAWISGEAGYRTLGTPRVNVNSFNFDEYRSIILEKYFTLTHLGDLAIEWNHTIHNILKECVHVRLLVLGFPKWGAKLVTFISSAYWHGFFPGYYILVIIEVIMAVLDEIRIERFMPLLEKFIGKKYSFYFSVIWIQSINYILGATWDLYYAKPFYEFTKIMKFGPYIAMMIVVAIGLIFGPKPQKKNEKRELKKE